MTHDAIVHLIRDAVEPGELAWADFGSGDGAFTVALRELLGEVTTIYSVDRRGAGLTRQRRIVDGPTRFIEADFTQPLTLPPLDGLLLANSLHFVRDQRALLARVRGYLKPAGKLLIVEYDLDGPTMWVPYPLAYPTLAALMTDAGYQDPTRLATAPTRWGRGMYAALARSGPPAGARAEADAANADSDTASRI